MAGAGPPGAATARHREGSWPWRARLRRASASSPRPPVASSLSLGPNDYRAAVASSVGGGALVAAIALGVVLTYRSSGVVNFANAAMAMYAAYVYDGLRRDGELFLPPLPNPLAVLEGIAAHVRAPVASTLPDWPTSSSFGAPLTFGAAFVISLVVAALAGAADAPARIPARCATPRRSPRSSRRSG